MDQLILKEKIESLRRCVARVEEKRTGSVAELAADTDRQDILTLNLIRAVQICVDITAHIISESQEPAPQTMAESIERLAQMGCLSGELATGMKRAIGFRNVAVHQYQIIDWEIVHHISHEGLADFRDFAGAISEKTDS